MSSTRPIPQEAGSWLLGKAADLARAPHLLPAQLGWRHGGVVRFRLLHHPFLAITDPSVARQMLESDQFQRSYHYFTYQAVLGRGLFSTDGPHWARRRRMVLPAFRRDRGPRFNQVMLDAAGTLLARWSRACDQGQPVDAVQETQRLTLAVIGRALLSVDVDAATADHFAQAVQDAMLVVRRRNTSVLRWPLWVPTATNRQLQATRAALDAYIGPYIDARLARGTEGGGDILEDLRQARDGQGQAMARDALLEETKTLFVAGYETTAVSLAWALYLLAGHPDIAARWHDETDRLMPDGVPDHVSPDAFPYTAAIVNEAMRLYPAAYNVARVCVQDCEIDGYAIRRGETALISIYGIQRAPTLWTDPDLFQPERFLQQEIGRDVFLPFASGKHLCIGASFARAEMITALALIGRKFRLHLVDADPPGLLARVTLAPARPIPVRLERRS